MQKENLIHNEYCWESDFQTLHFWEFSSLHFVGHPIGLANLLFQIRCRVQVSFSQQCVFCFAHKKWMHNQYLFSLFVSLYCLSFVMSVHFCCLCALIIIATSHHIPRIKYLEISHTYAHSLMSTAAVAFICSSLIAYVTNQNETDPFEIIFSGTTGVFKHSRFRIVQRSNCTHNCKINETNEHNYEKFEKEELFNMNNL